MPNIHAQELGRLGGRARNKLSPQIRQEIARKAGLASGMARRKRLKVNKK